MAALLPRALRSRVRRLTLSTLMRKAGKGLSVSEICREANLSMNQVIGAIRGTEGQYDPNLSLLSLQLVREESFKSGKRLQKVYVFYVTNPTLLERIEHSLERYRRVGEE